MQANEFAENNMGILNDRLAQYTLPQEYMEKGVYPYFRTINSHQDTEV
jgi:8-amino-7-oxononanoate synthase